MSEHPDLARMRAQEAAAVERGYTDGDVNHNVQPVIGVMRLIRSKGQQPTDEQMDGWVKKLYLACDAETAFLAERKNAARTAQAAPQVAMITPAGSQRRDVHDAVPIFVWNLLRRATRTDNTETDTAPTGWLYTGSGARNLDEVLAAMWSCPEAVALRDVPHTSVQYREPHLTTMEQAQLAMNAIWAEFASVAGLPQVAQEKV